MKLNWKKAWKKTTPNQRLMAAGDAVGGFALATLYFSYWGSLEQITLGWVLLLVSVVLQIPYWNDLSK